MKSNFKLILLLIIIIVPFSCKNSPDILYQSDAFTLYKDKIIQGNNKAEIISPTFIKSNYHSYSTNDSALKEKEWKLSLDISGRVKYHSEQPVVDALFNMSIEEAIKNIEPDSTFRTGALWGGVWTRDISYSILLAFAYHEPKVAMISLMKKVKRNRIIQDTGSGGSWPVSSDRTIWASAAWEIYKVTGDKAWLKQSYEIIKNTLDDDIKTVGNSETGLYMGESSFLDWREQTYPKWMSNVDIYISENLGTNAVHYHALKILDEMGAVLGLPDQGYLKRAEVIKNAVNRYLWMEEKGYYAQYLYGRKDLTVSPRFEALGEALTILFDIADTNKSTSVFEKSPLTDFGVSCIYPQIPDIPPYHNNAVWPFVQSYWNLAAAKAGNEKALTHGLAAIYRAGGLFLTNYENFVAQTGDYKGTQINSGRMLWSMAGNLAMVHRIFIGMSFDTNGIRFNPVIPKVYSGTKTLSDFRYRNSVLKIMVKGYGNKIASIKMDGSPLQNAFFSAGNSGEHSIEIEMDNRSFDKNTVTLVPNHFSLKNPGVKREGDTIKWEEINGAVSYLIYKDGIPVTRTTATKYLVNTLETAEYKVSAVDSSGWESFTCEPVLIIPHNSLQIVELEQFARKSKLPFTKFSGGGFIALTDVENRSVIVKIKIENAGRYLVDFRYSNGSGPWNTDNKCAIRSLYANNGYAGTVVMPQRGKDLWSDWAFSNSLLLNLKEGVNILNLKFDQWNINMNVDVNEAMLDYLRLIKL